MHSVCLAVVLMCLLTLASGSYAQDMMRHVDLTSPEMVGSELTREEIEHLISQAGASSLDLSGKRLSGLDLSGLNLRGANLRLARLNKTKLVRADLSGAVLDQAWAVPTSRRPVLW